MIPNNLDVPGQIFCLTPLYHFSSDASELLVGSGVRIFRNDESLTIPCDEETAKHLQIQEPDYLLWYAPLVSGEIHIEDLPTLIASGAWAELVELFLAPTRKFFELLRLFKPGRLRAGETFILRMEKSDDCESWHTVGSGRASSMVVDYSIIASQSTSYSLNEIELPFLTAFRKNLWPVLLETKSFPNVELALQAYAAEEGDPLNVVVIFTALEALLTKQDETEGLSYRLSMRIANLLGQDAGARREIFLRVKKFYNLRSRIVHGGQLKPAQLDRLNDLDALREVLRRILLSVFALISEGERPDELPALVDELALDDEKRSWVHSKASKFLHMVARP